MKTQDNGNNETISRGIAPMPSGYVALTFSESRTFKTYKGACRWLAKRGYLPNGARA